MTKTKMIKIDSDEFYPYYFETRHGRYYDATIVLTEEEYDAWQAADAEFRKWQDFIRDKVNNA